ncbi:MAG: ATP-binding protein [Pseudomonadota bacterium]
MRLELRLLWPLAILAIVGTLLLIGSLLVGARQVDSRVRHHEEFLVRRGVDGQVKAIENAIQAQTVSDEAVRNLDNRLDPAWARNNLPIYLKPTIGSWDYLVVDGLDRAVWARGDKAPIPPQDWPRFAAEARPIIAEIRDLERNRKPRVADAQSPLAPQPIVITRVEPRDGKAYMWTASLVQPDLGDVRSLRPTSTIVLAGGFLTVANVNSMRDRYDLKDVRLLLDDGGLAVSDARARFDTPQGDRPIVLAWTPQRPAHDLVTGSAWQMGLVASIFIGLAILMVRSTRRAASDLMKVHHAQGEFLANMSHEIRTPLNGVNALAQALADSGLDPRRRQMAETIHGSGLMLEKLLSEILDLARIDAGGMAIEREAFNLATAVTATVTLMTARATARGLDLRLVLDPAADQPVLGDVTRLKQVLNNLISNAVKFTDKGYVRVTAAPAFETGPDLWRFTVEDTGIGFDAAAKTRLFQRFAQADGTVTRRFGGAGLGLAISRELAVKMGGSLAGEAELGRGATFTLLLPLPRATQIAAPPAPAPIAAAVEAGPPLRVLVSEDHPVNRLVLETLLATIGADVVSTENGLEACQAFETQGFDVILMDMQMPVMDGLTAIRRIRERETARHLARSLIVMVTANALPEHRAAGLAAGADAFLTKPLDGHLLIETIETGVGSEIAKVG